MNRLKLGKWVIEIDPEATKEYYHNFTVAKPASQCYRNFSEYCKSLSLLEREFFDMLGILPEKCDVQSIGMDQDGLYPCYGSYLAAGRYVKKPLEVLWTVEDLKSHYFLDERPDHRFYVGKFQFTFVNNETPLSGPRGETGQPAICMEFFADAIPWLLDEDCAHIMEYPAKWWQFSKKLSLQTRMQEAGKKKRDKIARLQQFFERSHIEYQQMSYKESAAFMRHWIQNFVPPEKRAEAKNICYSNSKVNNYLWHAFSYEIAPCEKDCADALYNGLAKDQCLLLLNNEYTGYVLKNADPLTADKLEEYGDIIIAADDYKWTYVHTHERTCGPYFACRK